MADVSHKKRGRPARTRLATGPEPEPAQVQSRKKRRGRSSAVQSETVRPVDAKNKGRPRKQTRATSEPIEEDEEADDENEANSSLLRRSRRHQGPQTQISIDTGDDAPEQSVQQDFVSQPSRKTRRKRSQLAATHKHEDQVEEETSSHHHAKKRRGRPSLKAQYQHRADDAAKRSNISSQSPHDNPASKTARPQSRQVRSSQDHEEATEGHEPKGRKRRSDGSTKSVAKDQSPEERSSSPHSESDTPPPYRYIAKRTRRIPRTVIESKWSTLDQSGVNNVANILSAASRPVLLHVSNRKQYRHAEHVLEEAAKGLSRRSSKLPCPPASTLPRREDELDYERTQSAVEALRSQLDPLQHSVELLKYEKKRAEKELERDYKALQQLSTNARSEAREKRDQLRKMHVLVPEKSSDTAEKSIIRIDVAPTGKPLGGAFAALQDEELLGLASQIHNHMESMHGNLHQIDGVLPAIARSDALLKASLQGILDQDQFEGVMLG
ncbi:CENP-Q, a CENPA-CAD centromere complex subunit-domain-containing protein [Xylariaceae sp. FL1272]|nr:CENP-Q, a CENPA-CAD centromere complex subunit-domain-containing protein [Xylariaceae sp. FL1272]